MSSYYSNKHTTSLWYLFLMLVFRAKWLSTIIVLTLIRKLPKAESGECRSETSARLVLWWLLEKAGGSAGIARTLQVAQGNIKQTQFAQSSKLWRPETSSSARSLVITVVTSQRLQSPLDKSANFLTATLVPENYPEFIMTLRLQIIVTKRKEWSLRLFPL